MTQAQKHESNNALANILSAVIYYLPTWALFNLINTIVQPIFGLTVYYKPDIKLEYSIYLNDPKEAFFNLREIVKDLSRNPITFNLPETTFCSWAL